MTELWCVGIPEEPDSEPQFLPAPDKAKAEEIVNRLKREALQQWPRTGDVIAENVTLEVWKGTAEEHTSFLTENFEWWIHTTFLTE